MAIGDYIVPDFSDGRTAASYYNNWFQDGFNSSFGGTTNKQLDQQYERYLQDTQVQRMMKDIEAAGLNPWLALNGGSLPGGNYAQVPSNNSDNKKDSKYTFMQLIRTLFYLSKLMG